MPYKIEFRTKNKRSAMDILRGVDERVKEYKIKWDMYTAIRPNEAKLFAEDQLDGNPWRPWDDLDIETKNIFIQNSS